MNDKWFDPKKGSAARSLFTLNGACSALGFIANSPFDVGFVARIRLIQLRALVNTRVVEISCQVKDLVH
jgi:hypothetical protein